MKKLSILALAVIGLLFGACSSNEAVEEGQGKELKENSVGYFKVSLNLPYTPSTRSWEESNSTLQDGLESEYAVDNVLLVLFGSGADETENEAKVVQVSTLTGAFTNVSTNNPNQVTQKDEQVVSLTDAAYASAKLYALAVINGSRIIEASGSDLKINNSTTAISNATLADLQTEIEKATTYGYDNTTGNRFVDATSKHIFMTNAVLSNKKGGASDPSANPGTHILAPVNKAYIYETQAAAAAGQPATDIYVERGVAKVTLNTSASISVSGITNKAGGTVTAGFLGWCLDRTNSRSYIVRKVPTVETGVFAWNYKNASVDAGDKYRFVGGYPVDQEYSTATAGFRTYWALDPNYNAAAGSDLLSPAVIDTELDNNHWEESDHSILKCGDDYPQYCYENTFDVERQSYKNTTTIIVKVALTNSEDFYTFGADRKTMYPSTEIGTVIANALLAIGDFTTWLDGLHRTSTTLDGSQMVIDWVVDGYNVKVNDITLNKELFDDNAARVLSTDAADWSTWKTTIEAQVANIKKYNGGVVYYPVRIQHFGDDLTPWADIAVAGEKPKESTQALIYPGTGDVRNNAYLGRYGVVRNNWYDITISGISKIGYVSPAELQSVEHPDDELEDNFIKARINILSWAKRVQNWNLK